MGPKSGLIAVPALGFMEQQVQYNSYSPAASLAAMNSRAVDEAAELLFHKASLVASAWIVPLLTAN